MISQTRDNMIFLIQKVMIGPISAGLDLLYTANILLAIGMLAESTKKITPFS